jgi:hypothetical protein
MLLVVASRRPTLFGLIKETAQRAIAKAIIGRFLRFSFPSTAGYSEANVTRTDESRMNRSSELRESPE